MHCTSFVLALWKRLRDRVPTSVLWGALFLVALLLLAPRDLSWLEIVSFFSYAIFLFWVIWMHASKPGVTLASLSKTKHIFLILLVVGVVLFVVTRSLPFIRFGETPLGYDTGFYLQYMEEAFAAEKPTRQIATYLWTPLLWLGISPIAVLHGLYVLAQALTLGAFYALGRSISSKLGRASAYTMVFLFAFSIVQFSAYWWMFYQTQFAVAFLVMTIALLYRRSPLALLTGAFGAAMHTPTFFVFGGALFLYAAFRAIRCKFRDLEPEIWAILGLGLLAPVALLVLRGPTYVLDQLENIAHYKFLATNFPEFKIQEMLGLFLPPSVFRIASMMLTPWALIGILLYLRPTKELRSDPAWRLRMTPFFIMFVILMFLSSFPFVYQHRYFIYLSLAMIVFSAYPILLLVRYMATTRTGYGMLAVFAVGMLTYSLAVTAHQRPQMYADEVAELRAINEDPRAQDAVVMAPHPLYTPWVGAFSEHTVAAPGYYYNLWRMDQWAEMWVGSDDVRRHELLRMYYVPVYVFVGTWIEEGDMTDFFYTDPLVEQVSPHIFRYDTHDRSLDEIRKILESY